MIIRPDEIKLKLGGAVDDPFVYPYLYADELSAKLPFFAKFVPDDDQSLVNVEPRRVKCCHGI